VLGGLHHVTALAGSAQQNLDFYAGFLGLRLVKRTVNFDDPATHHFYFGGPDGAPGTLITFFPWGRFRPSRKGAGQAVGFAFRVAESALDQWQRRAASSGVTTSGAETRFGETVLTLFDPDGIAVELVASAHGPRDGGLDALHSVTLCETALDRPVELLGFLGFQPAGREGERARFQLPGQSSYVDILDQPGAERGKMGPGSIHHVAFAVADEPTQLEWRERLIEHGLRVSPVKDRSYFHSIYFREPGGVLFEIATLGPGFLIDESLNDLGSRLCLPTWLEPVRESLEPRLTRVHIPPPAAMTLT
jgi:glyoxalase family protein